MLCDGISCAWQYNLRIEVKFHMEENKMTKEHEMKNNLCKYVKDLAISDLFILTLYLEDLSKPKLPDAAT